MPRASSPLTEPMPGSPLASFIDVPPGAPFPIQNLPYGVFKPRTGGRPRVGVAIGAYVLDLAVLEARGLFEQAAIQDGRPFSTPSLNRFMGLGPAAWQAARATITHLLRSTTPTLRDDNTLRESALHRIRDVELLLPAEIGDYTDFYSSKEHATNIGRMFRGEADALLPNWLHLPVAYHGRASSVIVSGTDVHRPRGQIKPDDGPPRLAPSQQLDFELEVGFFVGLGNALGEPISVDRALDHVFGMVLVNDWSARDVQRWEYVPLGPFLGKNFATTVSPWVVPMAALEPFRCAGPEQNPAPLPYLRTSAPAAYDLHLEAAIRTSAMQATTAAPHVVCHTNTRYLYWSVPQQLAHHTVNGCNLRPGDLLASGTISGPAEDSYGSLLELAWRGEHPLILPGGETRAFLEDGDVVTMTAWAQGDGYRIGFGEASGRVLPALG